MSSYLSLDVPIYNKADWLQTLKKDVCAKLPADTGTKWHETEFHITVAFMGHVPRGLDVLSLIGPHLGQVRPFKLTFDKIEAFRARAKQKTVVALTATQPPASFVQLGEAIRGSLKEAGCQVADYRLHVTLAEVYCDLNTHSELEAIAAKVSFTPFSLSLKNWSAHVRVY